MDPNDLGRPFPVHFVQPPAAVTESLRASFALWAERNAQPGRLRRVLAALVSDLAPGVAVAGSRGVAGAARQLTFESEPADLIVQITAHDPTGWRLQGVVLAADESRSFTVRLESEDGVVVDEARAGDDGEFQLVPADGDRWCLIAVDDLDEVVFGPFDLRSPA